MTTTAPRVLVRIKTTGTCYLSNQPPFNLILQWKLCDSEEQLLFLEDGFAGAGNYQPINSNQVIQCFDDETGEQVQIVHQGTRPVFFESGAIHFTSSNTRQPEELPFLTSSLRAGRKYRLRFKPTTSISHWPASAEDALYSLQDAPSGSVSASDIPTPSSHAIPWEATDGKDTVVFETRSSRPSTPNVTASLSTPSTHSLSKPFTFTLTFSTNATQPITVLAARERPISQYTDVKILDATSRSQLFPNLFVCGRDDEPEREDFLRIEGAYTEHREVDPKSSFWSDIKLELGKEYILSHEGGTWWWTEDTINEVMDYLNSRSSAGLSSGEDIEFAGADEGLKIRTVDVNSRQQSFGQQFVWKGEMPNVACLPEAAHYQTACWPSTEVQVAGFPGWRLMKHLPLVKQGNVLYGITVYCATEGGISGLESHFRSSGVTSALKIGHRTGCAIHFRLAESEYFYSAWVLCDESIFILGPFLKLRTSENRTACFKPLLSTPLNSKKLGKGRISGIYCNALQERYTRFRTIGMTYDPDQPVCGSDQPVTDEGPETQYSTHLTAPLSGTFGSTVKTKDIATIHACYVGNRCTGLAFTLTMGRIEILGQWFECTGRHTVLYKSTIDKDFKGLRFRLHGASHIAVVCSVTTLPAHSRDVFAEDAIKDATCDDTVGWIFSEAADEICVWPNLSDTG